MRWLGRMVLLLLFGWVVLAGYDQVSQWQGWRKSTVLNWDADFSAYSVYWLDKQQPLTFDIPANAEQVRVQLTATVLSEANARQNEYSIGYQVSDKSRQVIKLATRNYILDEVLPQTVNGSLPDRFFDRPDGIGARLTSGFFVDNAEQQPIRSIKLSLQQSSGVRVAVRVSVLERKSEADLAVIWQRMHRDKRLALMAENIYPAELVSEAQRRTVLKYSWLPVGPEGIEAEDYHTATLFIKNNIRFEPVAQGEQMVAQVSHMLASPDQVFTFLQSPDLPVASLNCAPLDGSRLDWLEVLTQDQQKTKFLVRRILIGDDLDKPFKLPAEPMLYQIRTSTLCQLGLYDEQGVEIEPPAKIQRGYLADPGQSLSYALALDGEQVQPVRLDIRGLSTNQDQGYVNWQVQDEQGEVLLSGRLELLATQDKYQSLPLSDSEEVLTSKNSRYILAPANSAKLVIEAVAPAVLVNVFTRPLMLGHKDDFVHSNPLWFALLPSDNQQLKADGHSRLFYYQQKPLPVDVPIDTLSQWQALASTDGAPTYPLLVSQQSTESPSTNYQAINASGDEIEFVTDRQSKSLLPKLVYVQQKDQVQKIRINVDDNPFEFWLGAQAGQLTLPSMTVGKHRLKIEGASDTQWYINHLAPESVQPQASSRVRNAYALNDSLGFAITKQTDEEWVSFHYFPAKADAHTIKISLQHSYQSGDFAAHTLPLRSFMIPQQTGNPDVYLLNQGDSALWQGYLLKFPLDKDLSNGQYYLNVSSGLRGSGFVQASYVLTDVSQVLHHYIEVENAL